MFNSSSIIAPAGNDTQLYLVAGLKAETFNLVIT